MINIIWLLSSNQTLGQNKFELMLSDQLRVFLSSPWDKEFWIIVEWSWSNQLIQLRSCPCHHYQRLRRGVRSDVQLSCTATRFQKCPQSGNNCSKYPMLSISIAYNVISCKKSKETLKKSKLLILQCKFGSRAQKWPKIAKKTDHSIAIYSIFLYRYGIFWMPPGESSHPGGSEYV